ncbi:protein TASOR-like isoform X2 [Oscarella lobularis]|uniref:protein TASOR-like isoform X2 n=1 Tax=Oscarella lobularis TaxID=121494 RepID=UPI00331415EC
MSEARSGFVIPKRTKEKNLLEKRDPTSRDGQEMKQRVVEALKKPQFKECMIVHEAYVVKNERLQDDYLAWKRERKRREEQEDVDVTESTAFIWSDSHEEVLCICQDGLSVKATGLKRIGDPEQGVYVYRYPDFTSSEPWTRGEEGFFVIFKLIKGARKTVLAGQTFIEPKQNCDCHVAQSKDLFDQSLIYVYEYLEEEEEFSKRPRQCCPIGVLHCTITPDVSSSIRPHLKPLSDEDVVQSHKERALWQGQLRNKNNSLGRIALHGFTEIEARLFAQFLNITKRLPYSNARVQSLLVDSLFEVPHKVQHQLLKVVTVEDIGGRVEKLTDMLGGDVVCVIDLPPDGTLYLLATLLLARDKNLFWESEMCAVLSTKIQTQRSVSRTKSSQLSSEFFEQPRTVRPNVQRRPNVVAPRRSSRPPPPAPRRPPPAPQPAVVQSNDVSQSVSVNISKERDPRMRAGTAATRQNVDESSAVIVKDYPPLPPLRSSHAVDGQVGRPEDEEAIPEWRKIVNEYCAEATKKLDAIMESFPARYYQAWILHKMREKEAVETVAMDIPAVDAETEEDEVVTVTQPCEDNQ